MTDPLAEQTKALESQLETFQTLLSTELSDPATIYLGSGYFASVPLAHAKDFLSRKIDSIKHELDALQQLGGLNEEGLPILEIVEQLDDDDQVIGSTVNRTGLNARLDIKSSNDSGKLKSTDPKALVSSSGESAGKTADPNNSTEEKTGSSADQSPIPLVRGSDDDDIEYIEDISSYNALKSKEMEDKSIGEYRDIDISDILQLELSTPEMESDAEPVGFDFDDIDEDDESMMLPRDDSELDDDEYDDDNNDDDDDDDYDSDGFGSQWNSTRGSLFPQDEATRKLIELHLAQNAKSIDTPSPATDGEATDGDAESKARRKTSDKSSHVHFSEKVDVCEFETSATERKLTLADTMVRKPSRFKVIRQNSHLPKRALDKNIPKTSPHKPGISAAAAAMAAAAVVAKSPSKGVHSAIREREAPKPHSKRTLPSSPLKPVGRVPRPEKSAVKDTTSNGHAETPVKPSRAAEAPSPNEERQSLTKPASASPEHIIIKPQTDGAAQDSKGETVEHVEHHETSSSTSARELQAKIEADANKIYEESFIPDDDYVRIHNDESEDDTSTNPEPSSQTKTSTATESERPILATSVVERPASETDGLSEDEDNSVDMKEIKKEYQRLRQKLIYGSGGFIKKDAEKAVEPLTTNGEVKKVSRFKAARI